MTPSGRVQSINVLFSRKDWFPEARIVELKESGVGGYTPFSGISYDSLAASKPLTTTQAGLRVNLANEGTKRRFYDRFIIVPMDGPVRIEFDKNVAASAQLDPPVAPKTFDAANVSIDIGFNVDNLIDERWTNPVPHEFNAPGRVEGSIARARSWSRCWTRQGPPFPPLGDRAAGLVAAVALQLDAQTAAPALHLSAPQTRPGAALEKRLPARFRCRRLHLKGYLCAHRGGQASSGVKDLHSYRVYPPVHTRHTALVDVYK